MWVRCFASEGASYVRASLHLRKGRFASALARDGGGSLGRRGGWVRACFASEGASFVRASLHLRIPRTLRVGSRR